MIAFDYNHALEGRNMKLLRRSQVCEELNISTATLYRKLKDGTLPEPVRLGPRCSRWRSDEIEALTTKPTSV